MYSELVYIISERGTKNKRGEMKRRIQKVPMVENENEIFYFLFF